MFDQLPGWAWPVVTLVFGIGGAYGGHLFFVKYTGRTLDKCTKALETLTYQVTEHGARLTVLEESKANMVPLTKCRNCEEENREFLERTRENLTRVFQDLMKRTQERLEDVTQQALREAVKDMQSRVQDQALVIMEIMVELEVPKATQVRITERLMERLK